MITVDIWTFTAMGDGAAESQGKHEGEIFAIFKADLLLKGEVEAADNIITGTEHSTLSAGGWTRVFIRALVLKVPVCHTNLRQNAKTQNVFAVKIGLGLVLTSELVWVTE